MTDAKDALRLAEGKAIDAAISPPQYTSHPSGVECIRITEHMGFCLEDGTYAIMRVEGRNARTLYLAYSSKDASELIESLEFSELMSKGVPKELVDAKPKPRGTGAVRKGVRKPK